MSSNPRSKQLNNKMKAATKYQQSKRDTDRWLEGQERKVAQLPAVSGNFATLQTQVDQVKVSSTHLLIYFVIFVSKTGVDTKNLFISSNLSEQ